MQARYTKHSSTPQLPRSSSSGAPPSTWPARMSLPKKVITKPLSTSHSSVRAPTFLPAARVTLVVPMLPEPTVRTSTLPNALAKMRPKGMAHTKNATAHSTTVMMMADAVFLVLGSLKLNMFLLS